MAVWTNVLPGWMGVAMMRRGVKEPEEPIVVTCAPHLNNLPGYRPPLYCLCSCTHLLFIFSHLRRNHELQEPSISYNVPRVLYSPPGSSVCLYVFIPNLASFFSRSKCCLPFPSRTEQFCLVFQNAL